MNSWWNQERIYISKRNAYIATFILVALSSIVRIWPLHVLGSYNPYLTYYPAIIIAAVIGGFFTGILATALTCLIISLFWWLLVNEPFIKVPMDWLAMMLFVFNGTLISLVSESMRRANERSRSERQQLEFALNAAQFGYWDLNLKTGVADRSLLHDQIFGYAALLTGWTYELFLSHVHPDDFQFVDEAFKTALTHHQPWEFQCRIYRADDKSMRWIWASAVLFKIGKNEHLLGLVQDITQRKNDELVLRRLTSKMNALLEATPDCLIISNKEGQITFVNAVAEKIFGYTAEELIGQKIEFLIPARFLKQHVHHREHYFDKPNQRPMGIGLELYGQHKDGHEFPVEISISPIETEEGLLVLATIRDITDRKKSEDAKAMLLALVESSDEAIIGKDLKGTIFSWNKAAELLYGYTETDIIGCNIKKLFPADKQDEFDIIIQQIIKGEHIKHKESVRVHKDGHRIPVSITISPIKNGKGEVVGASTTARDITQQKLNEEKLKHLAEHDPLTGLINRAFFDDRLEQAIALSKRQRSMMAVCFIDIDDFKLINDQYGHATGDLLLCAATKRIQTCVRASDTLARLGGDEFALILFGIKNEHDVIKTVKKMIQCLSKGFLIETKALNVTLSVGASFYPKDGHQSLIEKADAAMYDVKKHGKNNFKLFDNTVVIGRVDKGA
ncbi:MAG: PAS domain S-box protein [Gammaproteobacteria bacterium]|nr:PAS domain S-box protein [Gammaproteobacteria bacterium]